MNNNPQNPLPSLTADWKAIRRLADALTDAIAECVDGTVQELVDEFDLPDDEPTINAFTDYVYDLATRGEATWPNQ